MRLLSLSFQESARPQWMGAFDVVMLSDIMPALYPMNFITRPPSARTY